ncbi:hypothetical protein JD844_001364 [Phrynosoma platyrhinos]|uniref:TMEM248/TMEM219 domain-containing protein n=1 Tax=Phrynosoma platyrhinos TaxID=52577 RepID=A0ABQ7T9R2_PHRPL|nr:hypothetical protein JD844_001364 [Phrynosoma platyrhinos]
MRSSNESLRHSKAPPSHNGLRERESSKRMRKGAEVLKTARILQRRRFRRSAAVLRRILSASVRRKRALLRLHRNAIVSVVTMVYSSSPALHYEHELMALSERSHWMLPRCCSLSRAEFTWAYSKDDSSPFLPSPLGLIMVICSLLGSLRVCLERHPPLVTFFFCLLSLAVASIGFSAYIQSHEVQNPDVKEDWNSLLQSLAQLMFCVPNKTQENASPSPPSTTIADSHTTVSVIVGLTFDLHNGTDPPNGTHLSLTVSGTKLGLRGPDAKEPIHVLAVIMNSDSRESCLSIIAPSSLLPKTRQPLTCVIEERDMHLQEPGICYQSQYQTNPALSSMLDQVKRMWERADRALCSQRLLMTGVFLLCLCAMLCCAASLCYPVPREKLGQI